MSCLETLFPWGNLVPWGVKKMKKLSTFLFWVHFSLSNILADTSIDNLFIICDGQSHRHNGNPQSLLKWESSCLYTIGFYYRARFHPFIYLRYYVMPCKLFYFSCIFSSSSEEALLLYRLVMINWNNICRVLSVVFDALSKLYKLGLFVKLNTLGVVHCSRIRKWRTDE